MQDYPKLKYAVVSNNLTIAVFARMRDARELVSQINWNKGQIALRIVKL